MDQRLSEPGAQVFEIADIALRRAAVWTQPRQWMTNLQRYYYFTKTSIRQL